MTTTEQAVTEHLMSAVNDADLQQKAKDHLWMHFARQSVLEQNGAPIIVRGEGHHIWDSTGKRYFDGLSGLFVVNAGHGLHYGNVQPVAALDGICELNIGHAIVAQAVFDGWEKAVRDMKALMVQARLQALRGQ